MTRPAAVKPSPKPKRDPEFMREIGRKGGKNSTFRAFRDIPGLAKKAGKTSGYTFRRKRKSNG